MFTAVLCNPSHPEYGVATVPFPIDTQEYDHTIQVLSGLEIGDAVMCDCHVKEIGDVPILKRLEKSSVNVDELDYLAKRLDGFSAYEMIQFQSVAVSRGYSSIKDLINLTSCCQECTVITDFSDLAAIGKKHAANLRHGIIPNEMESNEFVRIALALLLNEPAKVTPYGVVYDNGMVLDQHYDGLHFPEYWYHDFLLEVKLKDNEQNGMCMYLPASKCQIERVAQRLGLTRLDEAQFQITSYYYGAQSENLINTVGAHASLLELNKFCASLKGPLGEKEDLVYGVFKMAAPTTIQEAINAISHIDLFDFIPNISNAEEYGRYMIQQSERYHYDPELEEFYDYDRYGRQRMASELGLFTDDGYISYHGLISIDELLAGVTCERWGASMEEMA